MNLKVVKKLFPYRVKVKDKDLRKYVGYSDLIPTYTCCSQAMYFVVFPKLNYDGYFDCNDVEELKK